jgi:hypothetical protein
LFPIINGSVVNAPDTQGVVLPIPGVTGGAPCSCEGKPLIIKRKNKKESNYGFQIDRRAGDVQRDGKKVRSNGDFSSHQTNGRKSAHTP